MAPFQNRWNHEGSVADVSFVESDVLIYEWDEDRRTVGEVNGITES